LDEIGFGAMMDNLMNKYISPFARFLFPDVGGDNLNERHAFVVCTKGVGVEVEWEGEGREGREERG
jgi:hypothetical protein